MAENICIDKITGLRGEITSVSTKNGELGSLDVYLTLSNGEKVTRKIKDLNIQKPEEVKNDAHG